MRFPTQPLNAVDRNIPMEAEVKQTEATLAARRIGTSLPRPFAAPPEARPKPPEEQSAKDETPAEALEYQGEERRQAERRGDTKPSLLDTRARDDRRRQSAGSGINLKI